MRKKVVSLILAAIIIAVFIFSFAFMFRSDHGAFPEFFLGIEVAYDNVEACKRIIDKVRSYTNLFVVGDVGITFNTTKLNEVCEYAYNAGLYFIVFMWPTRQWKDQPQWIEYAKSKWKDKFLGIYAQDEFGGRQVDHGKYMPVEEAENYTDAANKYVYLIRENIKHYTTYYMNTSGLKLFTADYALYWFTYEAGYDVILTEFGWNHSRLLNVALCRGAATVMEKEWGAIITWTYKQPPYIESADELYHDMVLAYTSGAKYIIIFNYPETSYFGILTEQHFNAVQKFWNYAKNCPRNVSEGERRIAYVLPKDFGWAFRGSEDKIWGLWTDSLTVKIGNDINYLLHTIHIGLDIIYDEPKYYNAIMKKYQKLIFYNGTVITQSAFA